MLNDDITPARVSLLDDCYNIFCTRLLHAPPAVVRTLQALSGMMHGDGKSVFFHWQLAIRLFPLEPGQSKDDFKRDKTNNTQTAGRWLERTLEWMDAHNIQCTYRPGGRTKDTGKPLPSEVVSPFFDLVADLAERVGKDQSSNENDEDRIKRYLALSQAVIDDFNEGLPEDEQIWIKARTKTKPPKKGEVRIQRNEQQVIGRAIKCSHDRAKKDQVSPIEALAALLDETARKFQMRHPEECDGMRIVVDIAYSEKMGVNFDPYDGMGVNFDPLEQDGMGVNFESISSSIEQHFENEGGTAGRGVTARAGLPGLEVVR